MKISGHSAYGEKLVMNKIVTSIESYVNDALGVNERVSDCAKAGLISDFLRRKYQFYQIKIYYTSSPLVPLYFR